MKKIYRVKKEKDFKQIFTHRHSKANKQFIVYFFKRDNQQHIRIGISVSKKLGKAVVRNKIKRKIRRAFYEINDIFFPEYDIIVIARNPVVDMSVEEIKSSLKHVCHLCQIVKQLEGDSSEKENN